MKKIIPIATFSVWPSLVWAHGAEEYLFIVLPAVGGFVLVFASIATLIYWTRLKKQGNPGPVKAQILKYFFKIFIFISLFLIIIWGFFKLLGALLAG